MATIAGTVQSLANGTFHAKDENGNIRVLQEGDTIYENDTVYGDNGNSSSSKIEILLSGNDVIVLSEGQKQLIDSSLIETAFGTEELFFTREGLDLKADEHNSNADVVSDLRDAEFTNEQKDAKDEGAFTDANNSDVTKEETAEGQEEAEDETAPNGEFQARDGNATDIVSDLRNAQFKARTQVFIDRSAFENESEDRLTTINNIDRPSYTNPPVTSIVPPTNPTPPPTITNPTPPPTTPVVIIGNLSVNDVSTYESDGFLIFTVTLDRPVSTPITFDYVTSPLTATNNGIDYTDVKGTITIPAGSTNITIRVPVTDDYLSDNGETMKITISNVVGNANITKPEGIGTILDNPVNNPGNGTPNTPKEPGGYGQEDTVYAIIVGPVSVKEGDTTTEYTVRLVDKDGNAVVVTKATEVTVRYTNDTTQNGDTQFNNNDTIKVTIPANGSSNTFTVESIDDYLADNGEKYNVAITKVNTNEFENVVIGDKNGNNKDVTTEILDNSRPNTPNDLTDDNVEPTQDIILIKLFAADEDGKVIKDGSGNYVLANSVNENTDAKYIAYAFNNGETTFTDATRLATQVGKVVVSFTDGSATGVDTTQITTNGSQDFDNKSQTITIGESFSTKVFNDVLKEGTENYTVSIDSGSYAVDTVNGGYESVTIDTDPVTTTINDSAIPMKVFVKIEPVTDIVNESENLKYKLTIVDENGLPVTVPVGENITVELDYSGNTANEADKTNDYTPDISVTITGGTSSTEFELPTNDDYFAEGDEGLKITIGTITDSNNVFEDIKSHTIANGANSDEDTATGIIKDNPASDTVNPGTPNEPTDPSEPVDPVDNPPVYGEEDTVYVKITHNDSVIEGNTLTHTVTLVDKNGNPVTVPVGETITVTLVYSDDTTENADYDGSTKVTEVTILGGSSSVDVENPTIDDFVADNNEVYTLTITDVEQANGTFENVAIHATDDNVTGKILDGVILGDPVNAKVYEDGLNTSATTENDLGKSLGITNPNADTYTVSFDKTITTTDKTSNGQVITYSYNTDGTILTATRADNEVVFTVELKKDGSGNDVYDFKLKTVMDHEYGNNGKNEFDMPFSFNVTSNGTTSSNKTFNVTVVDSVPSADAITANTKEDTAVIVRLADDDFKTGEQVTINGVQHDIGATGIAIYEKGDTTKQIGSLTINSNGTVTFTPIEDYSNHDTTKSPEFTYTVKDFDGDEASSTVTINVKPVADTITITPSTPTMTEDDGNTKEGTHQVALGLTKPSLSKDQTDKNSDAGDHPERNGEITLTFTNGDKVTGAKIFKADGTTQVGSEITSANQTLKVVIVKTVGGSDIDYEYHHADVTTGQADTLYLTQTEYEALVIQHAEDNDTNIKIKIDATSYELDDSNKPLSTTDADLYETATANMTVKINPATDDISLIWDNATGGTISKTINDNDTFTFTGTQEEGYYFNNPIDLDAILSNTSGGLFGTGGTKADLDGSEKRTYTVTGIPEGTVIILGTQTAVANESGIATLVFNNTNNKAADPEFSMKLPEHYSGTISNAKITLSVQDKGVDSGDTPSSIKTAEVYFNVEVTPVADLATIQVSQAVGFEDAGRSKGNISNAANAGDINDAANGIALDIKVSSDDKDGSETFNVTIKDIPNGGALYVYDKSLNSGSGDWVLVDETFTSTSTVIMTESGGKFSVKIVDFQNGSDYAPKFIPPHNDDTDHTLKVNTVTVDTDPAYTSSPLTSDKEIKVIVKDVADVPVGTELENPLIDGKYVYKETEAALDAADNKFALEDIYEVSTALDSYDSSSETLSIVVDLPAGFSMEGAFYIENGKYVFKADDIGTINVITPKNFSGEAEFDLTYITTENAGDSKTHAKETVKIFVSPSAEAEINNTTTGNEDVLFKVDFGIAHKNGDTDETLETVKIKAADVTGKDFTLSLDNVTLADALTAGTITNEGGYYVLTATQADNIYATNTAEHTHGDYNFEVKYTIRDTETSTNTYDEVETTTNYTLNINAVTDQPGIEVGTVANGTGYTVNGNTVTVNNVNTTFEVPVKTTSADQDESENVTKIVISGVPMGVEVEGGTYYGYSGSEHNGIWVIEGASLTDTPLNADGATKNVGFTVNQGANFESRDITITTYTKDIDAEVKSASQTIHIEKTYTPGTQPGTPADLELAVKTADITEDTEFNLANLLEVNLKSGGSQGNGGAVITISDIPDGSTITGYDYSYVDAGKTYYVVVGSGNAADMNTQLSNVKITTPKDVNSSQEGSLQGDFTFTANIATYHNGGFNNGNTVTLTPAETISPLTDEMTVAVTADNINEDGTSNLSITLSNPSDGTKTELIGNSITIKVTENWLDSNANGEGTKGTLTQTGADYIINDNNDGTYTITKTDGTPFTVDTPITGLQYTPATNRDGNVSFEVSVQNKETGSSVTLDSKGSTTISVTPIIDVELNASVVTATGVEDVAVTVGSTTLANPVKLEITAGTFTDGSEKIGNIILDEVPNGFTVWYKVGSDLVMATNIGVTNGTFDLTPNISGDAEVHRNKWLIPASADGSMPEVYINAPTNWSGDFDFITKFTISEENLSTSTPVEVNVTGHINAVADGVTVDPTMTFGDAFSWVSLNLNANMKDTDGSETMTLELGGLDESAQFRYSDGTAISTDDATWDGNKWTIKGVAFDQINNIELLHDKSVNGVSVTAKTVDTDGTITNESSTVNSSFDLKLSDVSGNFTLDSGVSLDFNKIAELSSINTLKNVSTIDLGQSGENKLENITLQDVLNMTDSSNTLKITGTNEDKVTFSDSGWSKTAGSGTDSGFDIYTNTNDNSVQVKVEQNIQDQII